MGDIDDEIDDYLAGMFRFLGKVESQRLSDPDGCWNWPGAITASTGYGRVKFNGGQQDTHRVAWICPGIRARIATGESPTAIARDFGVNRRTISSIGRGTSWVGA